MSGPGEPEEGGGEAGFALAEILVAFAILALSTLAMMRAVAGAADVVASADAGARRAAVAQDVAAAFRARPLLAPGRYDGLRDDLAWSVEAAEVARWREAAPDGGARPLRLAVFVSARPRDPLPAPDPVLVTLVLAGPAGE